MSFGFGNALNTSAGNRILLREPLAFRFVVVAVAPTTSF